MTETDTVMLLERMEMLESLITQSDFGNKWMSTVDVQNYTGLSTKTIHRAVKKGILKRGDRLALLGIGSGINCLMLGAEW